MCSFSKALKRILGIIDEPKRFSRFVVLVIGIALFVRLSVFVCFWSNWEWHNGAPPDQWNELAINLVDHHAFGYFSAPNDSTVMRGPIFPFIEVPLYLLFGRNYLGWSVSLLFFDTFTCFLLMITARNLWGNRTALLAGLYYALNLPISYYTAKINQVTTILPMVVIWLYLFCLWEKVYFRKWLPWALGLLSGLMLLNKTVYLPVPIVCSAVLLWMKRAEIHKAANLMPIFIYLVVTLGVVAPWTYRNYIVTGGNIIPVQAYFWQPFVQDVLFYEFEAERGHNQADGAVLKYVLNRQDEILVSYGVSANPLAGGRAKWDVQCERAFARASVVWIKENPVMILKMKVANLWQYWVRAENWRKTRLFIAMQTVYLGAAIFGAILLFKYGQLKQMKYGLVLIVVLWAEYCLVFAYGRYSLDLVPILGLIFGLGVDRWAKQAQLKTHLL